MGYECRDDPQGAIQSLLTYSGSIRILNMSSTLIGRSFPRPKLVVDVVGACMDTIFSRQNYRSSLLRKSFFRGARDVGRCSVRRFSGHLDFFRFPHFPIQTWCSFFILHTVRVGRKYSSPASHFFRISRAPLLFRTSVSTHSRLVYLYVLLVLRMVAFLHSLSYVRTYVLLSRNRLVYCSLVYSFLPQTLSFSKVRLYGTL